MESKATAKFVRVSPRKTRLVARNVKGMPVEAAMNLLRFTPNKPAGVILGVVRSALANAEHNASMDVDALVVKEILVNQALSQLLQDGTVEQIFQEYDTVYVSPLS